MFLETEEASVSVILSIYLQDIIFLLQVLIVNCNGYLAMRSAGLGKNEEVARKALFPPMSVK
jgi:hypothetical protein